MDWAIGHIFPKIVEMQTSTNHLHRLTSLAAIKALSEFLTSEIIQSSVIAVVTGLAEVPRALLSVIKFMM